MHMSEVVDLTSSPEPDATPRKAANAALQHFHPRKQRTAVNGIINGPKSLANGVHMNAQPVSSIGPKLAKRRQGESLAPFNTKGSRSSSEAYEGAEDAVSERVRKSNAFYAQRNAYEAPAPFIRQTAKHPANYVNLGQAVYNQRNGKHVSSHPVLAGAGLAIVDLASSSEDEGITETRPSKRLASTSFALPQKRQRVDLQSSKLPRRSKSREVEDDAGSPFLATTKDASQQLQEEFISALSADGAQVPEDAQAAPNGTSQAQIQTIEDSFRKASLFAQIKKSKEGLGKQKVPHKAERQAGQGPSKHGVPYTAEEDTLLTKLKEVDGLSWERIVPHFEGRTKDALQVRMSTIRARRSQKHAAPIAQPAARQQMSLPAADTNRSWSPAVFGAAVAEACSPPPARRRRGAGVSAVDGFVSWASLGKKALEEPVSEGSESLHEGLGPLQHLPTVPLSRQLRRRELGIAGTRGWASAAKRVPDEMKNQVLEDYILRKHFVGTSGDVVCLAWTTRGERFAAGSIAITDDESMQYNGSRNLILGDCSTGELQELAEHHVPRPVVHTEGNVNALHSMRESQDSRLFTTVAAVGFSPDDKRLFTAGSDKVVRVYKNDGDIKKTKCRYKIEHAAAVSLLSVSNQGLLATACHSSADGSISVFKCKKKTAELMFSLSPNRRDSQSSLPLFPSAMKWGIAAHHSSFLLAGFSSDSIEEDRDEAGETALWDTRTGQLIELSTVTRNVFDVAWNPSPSSASTAFAIASTPGNAKVSRSTRSIVQLYAPQQNRARQVLEWECPAFDINDVLYCPYDDNLLAAGATDGKVYIWDQRFADRSQKPLHVLEHGESTNVLDHDRDRELVDTGVRFLAWGATSSRLCSGSSDGVVKVWNPYRFADNAHVKDFATFRTAIMSGAFSPDYRQLLIGEECGRINLLSIDYTDEDGAIAASSAFRLHDAKSLAQDNRVSSREQGRELLETKQIELRPMGDLPVLQAVQGPNYKGPFLEPSRAEWSHAEKVHNQALNAQHEAHMHRELSPSQEAQQEDAKRKADRRAQAAQESLSYLQKRHDWYVETRPMSIASQRAFREAENERAQLQARTLTVEERRLGCVTSTDDETIRMPDSRRSEQRIPHALRLQRGQLVDIAALGCEELYKAGLAGKCTHCGAKEGIAIDFIRCKTACQQRCASIKAAFSGSCPSCSAPVRKTEGGDSALLCERCAFDCFRCGRPVMLLPGSSGDGIDPYCQSCGLGWEAGVLGYDLVYSSEGAKHSSQAATAALKTKRGEDSELLHYHSRWQT